PRPFPLLVSPGRLLLGYALLIRPPCLKTRCGRAMIPSAIAPITPLAAELHLRHNIVIHGFDNIPRCDPGKISALLTIRELWNLIPDSQLLLLYTVCNSLKYL